MSGTTTGVAIIGAGPYGLSIAAHLRLQGHSLRVFGAPMSCWRDQMPQGMKLKSEGFACDLHAPGEGYRLADFCAGQGIAYRDIGLPVPLETFHAYGMEFQRRHVPGLDGSTVTLLKARPAGFELQTSGGESIRARQVIVAVGVSHFAHLPKALEGLPDRLVSHSSYWSDLASLAGRRVAVIGAGASAIELAALLHEAGSDVQLLARRPAIDFQRRTAEPRSLRQRLLRPRSGLGIGWRSRLCADAPSLFHALPQSLRLRAVARHLGPAPGWFVQPRFEGHVPMQLGVTLEGADAVGRQVRVRLGGARRAELDVDHVIAATGYRVALQRVAFLDDGLRQRIAAVRDTPVLDRSFESSVPGLFFVGPASANSFGPLVRFACGAGYTAERIAQRFAAG